MSTVAPQADASSRRPYRLSVAQYDELVRFGILNKNDRVELIDGLLVEKMTKNERHLTTTGLIQAALAKILPGNWFAVAEASIVLARSEPEPDVLVIRGQIPDYFHKKPAAADIGLVVEVAGGNQSEDRARCAMYGEAAVACYWIVNTRKRRIEVHSGPTGPADEPGFSARRDYGWHDDVPVVLDGVVQAATLQVRDLIAVVG